MMIDPQLLDFLRELKDNNNKEWFNPRKAQYKKMRQAFEDSLHDVAMDVAVFDQAIAQRLHDPATVKVFRIYRDVRFSKNKDPLKTMISGVISPGGERPAYYLHIEPGNCFAGGGIHRPSSAVLKAIRAELDENHEPLSAILQDASFKETFPQGIDRSLALKTSPRAYSIDHPAIEFLRLKSFTAVRPFSDEEVSQEGFRESLVNTFKALHPFNAYLDKALLRMNE